MGLNLSQTCSHLIHTRLPFVPAAGSRLEISDNSDKKKSETVNLRKAYLKRLEELVRFDTLRKGKAKFVVDALHGAGAGYLDGTSTVRRVHGR